MGPYIFIADCSRVRPCKISFMFLVPFLVESFAGFKSWPKYCNLSIFKDVQDQKHFIYFMWTRQLFTIVLWSRDPSPGCASAKFVSRFETPRINKVRRYVIVFGWAREGQDEERYSCGSTVWYVWFALHSSFYCTWSRWCMSRSPSVRSTHER